MRRGVGVVVLVMLGRVCVALLSSRLSTKVVSTFPPSLVAKCKLGGAMLVESNPRMCAALCSMNPDCNIYCLTGRECTLYSARATTNWDGILLSGNPVSFGQCFSLYHDPRDITHHIAASTSSTEFTDILTQLTRPAKLAYSGYLCFETTYCFQSEVESNPWWRAEFDVPRKVSVIKVRTREGNYKFPTFCHVEVRFGNSTIYDINPVFATYPAEAPIGSLVELVPDAPVVGQYLQLKQNKLMFTFLICQIQIIG